MKTFSVILFFIFIVQAIPLLAMLFLLYWIPALKMWIYNLLISIDQFGNSLLLGSVEETISSRLGRAQLSGKPKWYAKIAQVVVDGVCGICGQKNHCINAIKSGEDYSSELWSWEE